MGSIPFPHSPPAQPGPPVHIHFQTNKERQHEVSQAARSVQARRRPGADRGAARPIRLRLRRHDAAEHLPHPGRRPDVHQHHIGAPLLRSDRELLLPAGAGQRHHPHHGPVLRHHLWRRHHQQGGQLRGEPGLPCGGRHQQRLFHHEQRHPQRHLHRRRGIQVQPRGEPRHLRGGWPPGAVRLSPGGAHPDQPPGRQLGLPHPLQQVAEFLRRALPL